MSAYSPIPFVPFCGVDMISYFDKSRNCIFRMIKVNYNEAGRCTQRLFRAMLLL